MSSAPGPGAQPPSTRNGIRMERPRGPHGVQVGREDDRPARRRRRARPGAVAAVVPDPAAQRLASSAAMNSPMCASRAGSPVGLSSSTSLWSSSRAVMRPSDALLAPRSATSSASSSSPEVATAPTRLRGRRICVARSALGRDQLVDPLLDRPGAHHLVQLDDPRLADAVGAVGRLVLDRRVPPSVVVHDVVGGGQVDPDPAGGSDKRNRRPAARLLEPVDDPLGLVRGVDPSRKSRSHLEVEVEVPRRRRPITA